MCANSFFTEKPYVVDVNPRVNGSTGFQLAMVFVRKKKGFTVGCHRDGNNISCTLDELIEKLENISQGMAVLISVDPNKESLQCGIQVFADSVETCEDIFRQIENY